MRRHLSFNKMKAALTARREQLLRDVAQGLAQSKSDDLYGSMDSPEQASRSVDNEMVFQLVEMESEELEQIEDALQRIESGTYGDCEACGKRISRGRLEALPSASLCISCQAEIEANDSDGHVSGIGHWERLDEYERADPDTMETALDRGQKIT